MKVVLLPRRVLPAVLVALTLLAGCAAGDRVPLYPVHGQVYYKGSPAAGALVVFHPRDPAPGQSQKPIAYTDAEGRFTLTTEKPGDGAPAGEYTMTVVLRERMPVGREKVNARNLLPPRYAKADTSTLRFRVQEGENDLPRVTLTDE
jgi:hypothetical protein